MPNSSQLAKWGIFPLWLLLTLSVFFRPITPIDETRYLSVAWEMWLRQEFLVPYLNGATYSHKPPLLFWLINLSWGIFGVHEWSARLIGPICALLNLYLIRVLGEKLWPEQPKVALLAPWVLCATLLWTVFATSTMFDILLTNFVLLGMLGFVMVCQQQATQGWILVSIAIGLGVLTKGPVILVHLLPVALLIPLWNKKKTINYYRWYGLLILAILGGALIAYAWAIPAAIQGGEIYGNQILWSQTADRAVTTRIHARPFWWYLPFLPLLIFPWIAWPRLWGNIKNMPWNSDQSLRFCSIWFISCLLIFSLIQSKQIHYLIPLLPAFSLLISRLMTSVKQKQTERVVSELVIPISLCILGLLLILMPYVPALEKLAWVKATTYAWGASVFGCGVVLATLTLYHKKLSILLCSTIIVFSIFISFIFFFKYTGLAYNLQVAADKVSFFQKNNIPVAFIKNYKGQFQFLGRLTKPIEVIFPAQAYQWHKKHSGGYTISIEKKPDSRASYSQHQRERWLIFRTQGQK